MRRVRQPASGAEACMATARSKERSLAAAFSRGAPPDGLLFRQSVKRLLTSNALQKAAVHRPHLNNVVDDLACNPWRAGYRREAVTVWHIGFTSGRIGPGDPRSSAPFSSSPEVGMATFFG